jgi:chloramphenicol-sensitive protein RarD
MTFLLGAAVYHEPVSATRLISFTCVWTALAVFTGEALWQRRRAAARRVVATKR